MIVCDYFQSGSFWLSTVLVVVGAATIVNAYRGLLAQA